MHSYDYFFSSLTCAIAHLPWSYLLFVARRRGERKRVHFANFSIEYFTRIFIAIYAYQKIRLIFNCESYISMLFDGCNSFFIAFVCLNVAHSHSLALTHSCGEYLCQLTTFHIFCFWCDNNLVLIWQFKFKQQFLEKKRH